MRKILLALILLSAVLNARAQRKKSDTLLVALNRASTDTGRLLSFVALSRHYYISNPDSAIFFAQKAYEIAEKNKWPGGQAVALKRMGDAYTNSGDYVKSLKLYFRSLQYYEETNDLLGEQSVNNNIGSLYLAKQDYQNALTYLYKAKKQMGFYLQSYKGNPQMQRLGYIVLLNLGEAYLGLKKIDSAEYNLVTAQKVLMLSGSTEEVNTFKANIDNDLGQVAALKSNKQLALKYFRSGASISIANQDVDNLSTAYLYTAKLYHQYKQQDSAEFFARKAIEVAIAGKFTQDILNAGTVLSGYYDEDHNLAEAYKYYKITTAAKDSLYSQEKVKQMLSLDFDEKQRQQEIAAAREQYRADVRMYSLIAVLVVFLLLVIVFWRNANQRKAANKLLQKQKEEIQNTLGELKTTQNQLVQSAKMASLGELTAGIAH